MVAMVLILCEEGGLLRPDVNDCAVLPGGVIGQSWRYLEESQLLVEGQSRSRGMFDDSIVGGDGVMHFKSLQANLRSI